MDILSLILGLVVGVVIGIPVGRFLTKKSAVDVEAIAESIAGKVLPKQIENILQLAESKLSGKKEVIDGTLKTMKDSMTRELSRVEEMMQKLDKGSAKIDTRLETAATVIKELSDSTGSLKTALASNSSRGQWGERMAEDVLRLSGLIEGINFTKQTMLETGSKPDFTFILPRQLKLNMDVKFPFNNYQLYTEAKTEKDKKEYREKFLKDVRKRLKEVQTRDYINPEDGTVDYVLLFVPNEQVFAFINEFDRELIDEAMRAKTILCSPLSLYAILGIIRQSMDNFSMEVKSREMLTIFGAFKQQWEKFKDQMETVKERFETAHKGFEELTGARERMLDRQLGKIEELRSSQNLPAAQLEARIDQVKAKAIERKIPKIEEAML